MKRTFEDHALTAFHSEKFKDQAENIRKKRKKKKRSNIKIQPKLPSEFAALSQGDIEDNQMRNFIRSCIIGGQMKSSPRQIFAHIAGGALADGPRVPIYGYNNRSEKSIVAMQIFAGFILRAKLMELLKTARVISLFSDAESCRHEKLLMYGVHLVLSGYCCPLPLCFALGGISTTGESIRESLIHGVTADNILSGGSQLIPELAADINDEEVLGTLTKIKHLSKLTPIGIDYAEFIRKLSNSLTDGDSKYRFRLLKLLRSDQKEVMEGKDNLVSLQGTWCLNHCFSLSGDDLRKHSDIVDNAIKLIIQTRSFINASTTRSARLKVICANLSIKHHLIPEEFEDRFQA